MTAQRKPVAEREIVVTRVFAAPRPLVFSLWTDPRHLAKWWGPHGFTNPVCEADARPNGRILIHMRAPDGSVHPIGGIFHEVVPHERIVFMSFVDLPDGSRLIEGHNTVSFDDVGGKTRVTVHAKAAGFVDFAARMLAGMEAGWSQSLDKLAGTAARESGAKTADDEIAIRALFGDRTNALFGKVADMAVKDLAPEVVSYDLDPPLQHVGQNKAELQRWFDTWDGPIGWAMGDLSVEVGGDVAFAYGLGHMTGTKSDGYEVDLWVRCTVGFKRADGRWTVTHQHTSVPFEMDGTFKAAVDLRP